MVVGDDGALLDLARPEPRRRGDRVLRQRQRSAWRRAGHRALARRRQAGGAGQPVPLRHGGADVCLRRRRRAARPRWAPSRPDPRTPSQARMELTIALSAGVSVRLGMSFPPQSRRSRRRCSISPARSRQAGHEAWCVGGALRDALLRNPHADYDFATSATPEEVQRLFRRTAAVGVKYGTVGVIDRHRVLHEVTTFRRDVSTDGRHAVVSTASLSTTTWPDATSPSMRLPITRFGTSGGIPLAASRTSKAVDPGCRRSGQRFAEDYLRILRALRFSARFEFAIDPETWSAARAAAPGLTRLSAERVRDEWFKGLQTAQSVLQLHRSGERLAPLRSGSPSWIGMRTGSPEPPASVRDPVLLTALLTPTPSTVLRRLKASNAEIERASRQSRRAARAAGGVAPDVRCGAGPPRLDLQHRISPRSDAPDGRAGLGTTVVEAIRDRGDPLTRGDLAVSGNDVQALGAQWAGVGRVLAALLDRVLDEPVSQSAGPAAAPGQRAAP